MNLPGHKVLADKITTQLETLLIVQAELFLIFLRYKPYMFQTLFMATTYSGYIGVITGSKPGAFSISGDQRNTGKLWENLLSALEESWPTFFLERMVNLFCELNLHYTRGITQKRVTSGGAHIRD